VAGEFSKLPITNYSIRNCRICSYDVGVNATVRRVAVIVMGWAFILVGIVGLFLPILQGVLFIFLGLVILSSEYVWAHHLLAKLRQRFPKISHIADEAAHKAKAFLYRMAPRRNSD